MITDFNVGDKVKITPKSYGRMCNGNRSVLHHPCDDFIRKVESLINVEGTVTRRFRPGYEMNVTFPDGRIFHMKDHWVEAVPDEKK